MAKILIVEDDVNIAKMLEVTLSIGGYESERCDNGKKAVDLVTSQSYDLVLLDVMLPDMDGLDVLRRLREIGSTPIVIFSAQDEEASRIVGLEMGADDYVPKAFSPRELLARVRAVLRRAQPVQAERKEPEEDGVVRVRGLWMDRKSMKARMDGVPMDLTALEFRILFGMAAHPGRVFTRENLLELAVGREFSRYDRSVDMHISTLRRKLGDDPHNPAYLKTIRGMGYTLLPEEA